MSTYIQKVLKEAKNMRQWYICQKDKKQNEKALWQLMNREAVNFPSYNKKIELKTETGTTSNP